MSGPERCVNPRCENYGHIQDGPCTVIDKPITYIRQSYQSGRHDDHVILYGCPVCGALVQDGNLHSKSHGREPNILKEWLRSHIAPLEDNYGTEQFEALLDEAQRRFG